MPKSLTCLSIALASTIAVHAARAQSTHPATPNLTAPVVAGNTEFAISLYKQLAPKSRNFIFSPHSISTALALAYAGARGDTAAQIAAALHFPQNHIRLDPAMTALQDSLAAAGKDKRCTLHIANGLWCQQGDPLSSEFLTIARDHYAATARPLDFHHAAEPSRQTINAWVADQTQQLIKQLIPKGGIDSDTLYVLTNAIYFKGEWSSTFDPGQTKPGDFHLPGGKHLAVPMMHQTHEFNFADSDKVSALELRYAGNRLSMIVLLPKQADGIAALERTLSADFLTSQLKDLHKLRLRLTTPRFNLTCNIDLTTPLRQLGMREAFNSNADFSGINCRRHQPLSHVFHQARIEVNEQGTKAAAATAVPGTKTSVPRAFILDHPFLFLIRDRITGATIFMGRVENPAKS